MLKHGFPVQSPEAVLWRGGTAVRKCLEHQRRWLEADARSGINQT